MKKSNRSQPIGQGSQGESQWFTNPTNAYYDQSTMMEEVPVEEEGQDPMLHPPLWLFIFGGFEIVWGACCNVFQAMTSFTGISGWQNHELVDKYGLAHAMELSLSRSLGLYIIAAVLSIGAQIGIQAFTQQISRQWKEKRVVEHESTKQALIEIISGLSIIQIYGYASILVCVWSDYMYVTQIDSTGSFGSYILMTFWAIILGCSSTYVLMDGIQRFWSAILALRSWALWQDALKEHFKVLAHQYPQQ